MRRNMRLYKNQAGQWEKKFQDSEGFPSLERERKLLRLGVIYRNNWSYSASPLSPPSLGSEEEARGSGEAAAAAPAVPEPGFPAPEM